jgi:hypothetical protein
MTTLRNGPSGPDEALAVPLQAFVAAVSVGEILALGTKDVAISNPRLVYLGLEPGFVVPVKVFLITPGDPLVVCQTSLINPESGVLEFTVYNPIDASTDFGQRTIYVEMMSALPEPAP